MIQYLMASMLNCKLVGVFLGGVIAIKLAVLLLIGPIIWPDTEAYVSYAEGILARSQALFVIDFDAGPAAPIFLLRLAGYPLILAAANLISPPYYGQVTVFFQIGLNLLAILLMAMVLARLSFSTFQILCVVGLYAFSDSCFLTTHF